MEKFVLKGGNALDIVYSVGARSSVDVDVSMPDDFSDVEDAKERIFRALRDRFDSAGFVVFDERFQVKPSVIRPGQSPRWGGYQVDFKIADRQAYARHGADVEALRRNASLVGPEQKRTFRIDISKYEFVEPKEEVEVDNYTVYVYTLPMMAFEKLRAICQQMPEYELRRNPKPRARDFYDIHAIVNAGGIDVADAESVELVRNIFAAKSVPLSLIGTSGTPATRRCLSLNFIRIQIGFHKSKRALNDFERAFVVGLIVKTMNALRVVSNGQGDIFRESFSDEAVYRIVHCRNRVEPGACDKNRRDFLGIFCQVID